MLTSGRNQFRIAFRGWSRQWSQPQLIRLAEATLGTKALHSSQIKGLQLGMMKEPAPKCLLAIGLVNEAIAKGWAPPSLEALWRGYRVMVDATGKPLGPTEVFMAFTGMLDLGLEGELEIPVEAEERVSKAVGKHLRMCLYRRGVDALEERVALSQRGRCVEPLLLGQCVQGDLLLEELAVVAELCGEDVGDLQGLVREHLESD
ncbi:MAG: hypothetical protein ACO29V_10775 [Limnohabitans sp.]